MSEAKHTPGPWVYAPKSTAYGIQSPFMVWTSKGPGYGTVATTNTCGLMPTDPLRQAADARLIAAAPDLLAACKLAKERFDRMGLDWLGKGPCPLESAIAKAEGA